VITISRRGILELLAGASALTALGNVSSHAKGM